MFTNAKLLKFVLLHLRTFGQVSFFYLLRNNIRSIFKLTLLTNYCKNFKFQIEFLVFFVIPVTCPQIQIDTKQEGDGKKCIRSIYEGEKMCINYGSTCAICYLQYIPYSMHLLFTNRGSVQYNCSQISILRHCWSAANAS